MFCVDEAIKTFGADKKPIVPAFDNAIAFIPPPVVVVNALSYPG